MFGEDALHAGISARQVRRIENGQSENPRLGTLRKIADATGRDLTWIKPDLDAEEAELQLQLEAIDGKLDALLAWASSQKPKNEAVTDLKLALEEIAQRTDRAEHEPESDQTETG